MKRKSDDKDRQYSKESRELIRAIMEGISGPGMLEVMREAKRFGEEMEKKKKK